jgi:uncharacterized membrane protein YraQ (UPF0718 family)/copper chaperone CopZ
MFLDQVWQVLVDLAPWLLLGAGVAALIHFLLPPGFVQRELSGAWGVAKAVFLGVPLPLCSCGVIPTAIGLRKDGASSGASMGFLIATPQTGVDSIMVSAGLLGWPFALSKVLAALVTGLAGGWLTDARDGEEVELERALRTNNGKTRSVVAAFNHGLDLLRMIWRWLVVGIVVSAVLSAYLPPELFTELTGKGMGLAFIAVLVVSLPLYVCATASVPIAAAMVAAGMPTGAAMVFLMAGPATNAATLGAVLRAFGRRALAIYLTSIVVGSVGFGLGYEALFGNLSSAGVHGHSHGSWWADASAVVLLALLSSFAIADLKGAWIAWRLRRTARRPIEIQVGGMACDGCANRLSTLLSSLEGVELATVSFADRMAVVSGPAQAEDLKAAIRRAGFEA